MGFFIPNSMQNKDTHTDLKNWPCYLEKLHEDETTTFYANNFSGHRVFVHVQQGGQIFIQAENGIIINDYIKTVYKLSVFNDNGDKVCEWRFGKDHVVFRLEESGSISVSSNKIELVNLYCEPSNLKRVKDFLNRY